jgi:hypothetical protein
VESGQLFVLSDFANLIEACSASAVQRSLPVRYDAAVFSMSIPIVEPWSASGAFWVLQQYLGFLSDPDANFQFILSSNLGMPK